MAEIKTVWSCEEPLETQGSGFPDDCISKGTEHEFLEFLFKKSEKPWYLSDVWQRTCKKCGWVPPLKLDPRNMT